MAAAAIPLIIKAGSAVAAHYAAKKLGGASKPQQAGMDVSQQSAQTLGTAGSGLLNQGQQLTNQGSSYLNRAGNYYQQILGSRGAMRNAMAPETSSVLDYYRGAEQKLGRTTSGSDRTTAQAELDRQKVGQLALLPSLARRGAAEGVGTVGAQLAGQGANLSGQGIYGLQASSTAGSQLFNQGTQIRGQQNEAGKAVGSFLYDIIKSKYGGGGGGGTSDTETGIYS